jgi:hypothetical protein
MLSTPQETQSNDLPVQTRQVSHPVFPEFGSKHEKMLYAKNLILRRNDRLIA